MAEEVNGANTLEAQQGQGGQQGPQSGDQNPQD